MNRERKILLIIIAILVLEASILLLVPNTHTVTISGNKVILDGGKYAEIHYLNGKKVVEIPCCHGILSGEAVIPKNNASSYIVKDYVSPSIIAFFVFTIIYFIPLKFVENSSRVGEIVNVVLLHYLLIALVMMDKNIEVIPMH